jgi:zinc transporter ZupT
MLIAASFVLSYDFGVATTLAVIFHEIPKKSEASGSSYTEASGSSYTEASQKERLLPTILFQP